MIGAGLGGAGVLPALGAVLQAAPSPSDGEEFNSVTVSPGLPGFLATFVLAVVVVLLLIDMTRRVRRVQARARVEERQAQHEREEAEREQAERAADERERVEGDAPDGGSADEARTDGSDAAPGEPTDSTESADPAEPIDDDAPEDDQRR